MEGESSGGATGVAGPGTRESGAGLLDDFGNELLTGDVGGDLRLGLSGWVSVVMIVGTVADVEEIIGAAG